jgi:uncharacterized protein
MSRERSSKSTARCPICKAATETLFRPFCSKRCSDVDLSRWLNGSYAIASGGADADEDGDQPTSPPIPSDAGRKT